MNGRGRMEPDYDEIRKRITSRYNNRAEFISHLVAFVAVNGIVWFVLNLSGIFVTIANIILVLWGMGLVIHAVQFGTKEAQERAIEKAIERERSWQRNHDELPEREIKRKRDRLTLNHDGELMDIVEEDLPVSKRR